MFVRTRFASYAPEAGAGTGAPAAAAAAPPAPAAAAAPAAAGAASGTSFLEQIPETIRGEAYFRDLRDVGSLATRAYHQAKLIGADKATIVQIPGPDDAEGWNALYAKTGRPESAENYQLADPKDVPDGLVVSPEEKSQFQQWAHEAGLSQRQADALYQRLNGSRIGRFTAAMETERAGLAAAETALKAKWGAAYDQKLREGEFAIQKFAETLKLGPELELAVKDMPASSRVALGELFAHLGAQMREDGIAGSGGEGAQGALSPAEARQQINGLQGDQQFMAAYMNKRAPGHDDAVKRMLGLHEFLVPQASSEAA